MGKTTNQIMAGRNPHAAMLLNDPMSIARLNPNINRYGDDVTGLSRIMGPLRRQLSDIGGKINTPSFAPGRGGLGGMPEVRNSTREMGYQFRRAKREVGESIGSAGPSDTRSYMRAQKQAARSQIRAQREYVREQKQENRKARREAEVGGTKKNYWLNKYGSDVSSDDGLPMGSGAAPIQITPIVDRIMSGLAGGTSGGGRGPINVNLTLNIPQGAPVTRDVVMAMIGEGVNEIKRALQDN